MKKLKQINGFYVCEECGFKTSTLRGLSTHIQFRHNNKEYYDRWAKEEGDDKCKICGKPTKYYGLCRGYLYGCSKKHMREWNVIQIKKANLEKYGVESTLSLKRCKEDGMIKKYGVKNPFESKEIQEKIKKTNLDRHGVEYPSQSKKIQEKIKQSFLKKYGVEYALQNKEFFDKYINTSFNRGRFKTGVYYQCSYELDFLEKYHELFDIKRGPTFTYIYKDKKRYYFSDFFIESKNLIVEIKNSYLYNKDMERIHLKEQAVKAKGFNYILIKDKDYSIFNSTYIKP